MAGLVAVFEAMNSNCSEMLESSPVCRPESDKDSSLDEEQETLDVAHMSGRAMKTWVRNETEAVNARMGEVDVLKTYELVSRPTRSLGIEDLSFCCNDLEKRNMGLELRKGASAYFTEMGILDITNENSGTKGLAEGDETRWHEEPFGAVSEEESPYVVEPGRHGHFFNEQAPVFEALAKREAPYKNPLRRDLSSENLQIVATLTFELHVERTDRVKIYHKSYDWAERNSPAKLPPMIRFALRRSQLSSLALSSVLQRLREDSLSVPEFIRWESYGSVVYDVHHQWGITTPKDTKIIFGNENSPQPLILQARLWNLYHDIEDLVPFRKACWNYEAIRMEESPNQLTPHCYWRHDIEEIDTECLVDFVIPCGLRPYHLPDPRYQHLEPHLWDWRPSSQPQSMVPWVAEYRTLSLNQRRALQIPAEIVPDYRSAELHLTPTNAALAVMMSFPIRDEVELVRQLQCTGVSPMKLATDIWLMLEDSLSVKPAWSCQPGLYIANQWFSSSEAEPSEPTLTVFSDDMFQTPDNKAQQPVETPIEPPKPEVEGRIFDILKVAEDSCAAAPAPDGENLKPEMDEPCRFSSPQRRAIVRRMLNELPKSKADGCKFVAVGNNTESNETEAAIEDEKKDAFRESRTTVRQIVRMQLEKRKRRYLGRSPKLVMNSNTPATRSAPVSPFSHRSRIILSRLSIDFGISRQCVHCPPSGEFAFAARFNDPKKTSIISFTETMLETNELAQRVRKQILEHKHQVESLTLESKQLQDERGHCLKTRREIEFTFQRLNGKSIVEDRSSTTLPDLINGAIGDEETGFEDKATVRIGLTDLNDSSEATLRDENNLDSGISKAKKQVKFEILEKKQSRPRPIGVHLDVFAESLAAQSEEPVHVSRAVSLSGTCGLSFMCYRPKHRESISELLGLFAQTPHVKKHVPPIARRSKSVMGIRGGGSTTSLSSKETELSEDPDDTSNSGSFSRVVSDTPTDSNKPGDDIHPSDPRRHVPQAADNEWSSMSFREARDQAARNARLDRVPFGDYMQQRRRVRTEIKEAIAMDQRRNQQRDASRAAVGIGMGAWPDLEAAPPGPPPETSRGSTPGPYSELTPGPFSGPTLGSHSELFSGPTPGSTPGPAPGLSPGSPPTPSSVPSAGVSSELSSSPLPRARPVRGAVLRTDSDTRSSANQSSFFLSHFNGSNGPSSSSSSASSLHKLFDSYRDNVKQEPDRIGVEGSIRYLQDLGLKLDEPTVLAVLTELNAPTMGEFTRDGFVDGWTLLHADTLSKQKQAIPKLRNDLTSNPDVFKRTYKATFLLARQPSQKILPLDVAIEHWQLLFTPPSINWSTDSTPWLKWWIEFLQEKYKKAVSKDMWDQTGVFVGKSMADEGMGFWSEDGAWPSCIDEFVGFVKEKRGAGGTGEEMDVG